MLNILGKQCILNHNVRLAFVKILKYIASNNRKFLECDMKQVYEDNLIKLTDDDILFKKYYIPTFASKIIKLSRIEKIQVIKKTFFDQEIKLMGTDDLAYINT